MLARREEAPWCGCLCLCFPGVALVQCEWRMLSSRDGFVSVSGTCWALGSRVWGFSVCEWSLLGSGEQGFWCKWRMLGSGDWVFSVIRECRDQSFSPFHQIHGFCWDPGFIHSIICDLLAFEAASPKVREFNEVLA